MNRRTVIIPAGILVAIVLLFGIWAAIRNRTSAPDTNTAATTTLPTPAAGEATYTDPGGRFVFNYPSDVKVAGPVRSLTTEWRVNTLTTGYLLASLSIPKSFMPGTNFSDAKLTIGQSNNPKELSASGCPANPHVEPGMASAADINGQTYTRLVTTGAGAGNFYETTGYYTVRDGDCYAIEYTIHSTNIGNYPPELGIKEFDKAKVQEMLEKIVKSFIFTINSN